MHNWTPPENYVEIESKLPEVRVWKPLPKQEEKIHIVTYNCPHCGAPTEYDISLGGVACKHCGFSAKQETKVVGKQANELEFRKETIDKAYITWKKTRDQLHCDNCGAELNVDKADLSSVCPFCSSSKVNIQQAPAEEYRPQALIPIKKTTVEIRKNIAVWLGKGWFHPTGIRSQSLIEKINALYLPVWTFDAKIVANWKAMVGHERQKRYYDASSKTWKTKTVIDWRWEDGRVERFIDDFPVAGSKYINKILFENIQPYNLNELVEFHPDFLAGWKAHTYTKFLPDAWVEAKENMREFMRDACIDDIHSNHIRNFSLSADYQDETWRYVLLPVYLVTYNFKDETFQIMVNAQTAKVAGQKPVDWSKVWLAIAGLLAPGTLVGFAGLLLILFGGIGFLIMLIGAALFIFGLVFTVTIYQSAKKAEVGA